MLPVSLPSRRMLIAVRVPRVLPAKSRAGAVMARFTSVAVVPGVALRLLTVPGDAVLGP